MTEELQGSTYTNIYSAAAEKLSGTVFWMLQEGQPSTRQLLNSSQTVVDTYTTDAFGNSVASTGTAVNPFQWNAGGKYYSDSESGLQKVGARYYEPATGRWISQDSLLIAGSPADSQAVNRYLYCGANPIGRTDPGGHVTPGEVAGAILILLGAVLIPLELTLLGVVCIVVGFVVIIADATGIFHHVVGYLTGTVAPNIANQNASANTSPGTPPRGPSIPAWGYRGPPSGVWIQQHGRPN